MYYNYFLFVFLVMATMALGHKSWFCSSDSNIRLSLVDICSCNDIDPMSTDFDYAIPNGIMIGIMFRLFSLHLMYEFLLSKKCARPPIGLLSRLFLVSFMDIGVLASLMLLLTENIDRDRVFAVFFALLFPDKFDMFAVKLFMVSAILNLFAILLLLLRWMPGSISDAVNMLVDKLIFVILLLSTELASFSAGSPTWDPSRGMGVFQECFCVPITDEAMAKMAPASISREEFEGLLAVSLFMRYCVVGVFVFAIYVVVYPLLFSRPPIKVLRMGMALFWFVAIVPSGYAIHSLVNMATGRAYFVFMVSVFSVVAIVLAELK